MADLAFNTTANVTVARELLIAYLNTGTTAVPVWSPVGKRVEDSSIEYDWQTDTLVDIFGVTYTTGKVATKTQTFDPLPLDSADAAAVKIWNIAEKDNDVNSLLAQDMLIVHAYAEHSTDYFFAERYYSCAVIPTSLGGEGGGSVNIALEVTYGGTRETGKATITAGVPTFTADT